MEEIFIVFHNLDSQFLETVASVNHANAKLTNYLPNESTWNISKWMYQETTTGTE